MSNQPPTNQPPTNQPPTNPSSPFDYQKWINEIRRQDAHRTHDKEDEFHKAVNEATIKAGELAIRMALLVNGGAAVSLLTFVGSLPKEQKTAIANTLVWFASGVVLAVIALAASYATNYSMAGVSSSKLRQWEHPYIANGPTTWRFTALNILFHVLAVLTGLASLVAFGGGVLAVRNALTHL